MALALQPFVWGKVGRLHYEVDRFPYITQSSLNICSILIKTGVRDNSYTIAQFNIHTCLCETATAMTWKYKFLVAKLKQRTLWQQWYIVCDVINGKWNGASPTCLKWRSLCLEISVYLNDLRVAFHRENTLVRTTHRYQSFPSVVYR